MAVVLAALGHHAEQAALMHYLEERARLLARMDGLSCESLRLYLRFLEAFEELAMSVLSMHRKQHKKLSRAFFQLCQAGRAGGAVTGAPFLAEEIPAGQPALAVDQAAIDATVIAGLKQLADFKQPMADLATASRTAIAGMAMAGGHAPTRGIYHNHVKLTLDAIIENQDPVTGYLGANGFGRY